MTIRNSYRTFRVWKLASEKHGVTYNLEAENGFDEWKITSDIVNIESEGNSFIFTTINGSKYRASAYQEGGSRTNIVDQYMKVNGFSDKVELTEQEFLEMVNYK
jgi:hypothetical protein